MQRLEDAKIQRPTEPIFPRERGERSKHGGRGAANGPACLPRRGAGHRLARLKSGFSSV